MVLSVYHNLSQSWLIRFCFCLKLLLSNCISALGIGVLASHCNALMENFIVLVIYFPLCYEIYIFYYFITHFINLDYHFISLCLYLPTFYYRPFRIYYDFYSTCFYCNKISLSCDSRFSYFVSDLVSSSCGNIALCFYVCMVRSKSRCFSWFKWARFLCRKKYIVLCIKVHLRLCWYIVFFCALYI